MAHQIDKMMYQRVGGAPWHGLGTPIDEATGRDILLSAHAAGLDFAVDHVALSRMDTGAPISESRGIIRTDTGAYLGTVGKVHTPLQNMEMLKQFQPLLDERDSNNAPIAMVETAGSLKGGRIVWALVKINGEVSVTGNDTIQSYLLLSHSHDGSLRVRLQDTKVRVVCMNTLGAARSVAGGFATRHTLNVNARLTGAVAAIHEARHRTADRVEYYRALAAKAMSDTELRAYARTVLFGAHQPDAPPLSARAANILTHVEDLAATGAGSDLPGVRGTAWGAYNAVTDYLTHDAGRTPEGRLFSQWYGAGSATIGEAESLIGTFAGLTQKPMRDADFSGLMEQSAAI